MIMEPCVALKEKKKKHMYLSHCLHELLQFYRPQSRLGQSETWFCVYFVLEDAFPQRLLPKQKLSVKHGVNCCIFNEGEGCVVKGHLPTPTPPSLPAGFGVTLRPGPLALWPVFRWDCGNWGWAVRPWRINQKALLVRVFSSMLCLCVYPNALEDYLSWWGLLMCRTGWMMLEWFGLC